MGFLEIDPAPIAQSSADAATPVTAADQAKRNTVETVREDEDSGHSTH